MKKNIVIIASAVVAAVLMVGIIYVALRLDRHGSLVDNDAGNVSETVKETLGFSTAPIQTEPVTIMDFVSKKNFEELKKTYPHAYAWIEIPGADISYPIIQHPTDDEYYLRRDEMGNDSINGCIFTEHVYNTTDFTDPITLIYGHYVYEQDGYKYFGGLQTMYRSDLEQYKEIIIYHPEKELHYEVFAAVPYNQYHILWGEDFTVAEEFDNFISGIKDIKAFDATINKECDVKAGDNVIILSTCYNGRPTSRYLVLAKLVETIN